MLVLHRCCLTHCNRTRENHFCILKVSEMDAQTEKGQSVLSYDHKVLMQIGVCFDKVLNKLFCETKQIGCNRPLQT